MSNHFLRRCAPTMLLAVLLLLIAPACDSAADATRSAEAKPDGDVGALAQRDADEQDDDKGDAERRSKADADKDDGTRNAKENAPDAPTREGVKDGKSADDANDAADPPPALTHYLGREIATTMHYLGAPWLTRESREREEDSKTMLKELGLKPGMAVCDMGCGNGFYTLPIAEAVGEKGKVYAVDIQIQMLHYLKKRAQKQEIDNIEYVLGDLHDPKLPANSCDLILLVDVYHEFSHPVHMLEAMRKALKKDGQIVLVEFRAEDPKVPIKPLHKMSKKQILKELEANGYKLSKSFDKLPWQHMMFFKRESPAPKAEEEK